MRVYIGAFSRLSEVAKLLTAGDLGGWPASEVTLFKVF